VAVAALSALFFASVAGPALVLVEWAWRGGATVETAKILRAVGHSLSGAVPGALIATTLAVPIAFLARRFRSRGAEVVERVAYVGFATPAIVFGLGILFFVLKAVPFLYQTMFALIAAYSLHFLAQAIGPVRAGLFLASPRTEEAARALGHGPFSTFFRVTFPQIRTGLVAALTLVLLSCLKDLPIAYVLAPLDFEPLALEVWSYANEAMFAEAAPYALAMLALSGLVVGLLIRFEAKGDPA
jgi:iron(III) transport system permease protein